MIQTADSPWYNTFYLFDGTVVLPKSIYFPTSNNSYVCMIEGLSKEDYYILRHVRVWGRDFEDRRYDWRHVNRKEDAGRLLVDTLIHLNFY